MSQSPYMRAFFAIDSENDRQEREAKAEAARKAKKEEQQMQNLQNYVAKLKPSIEAVAKDAQAVKRTGVASAQIFSSHAALSADLGVTDQDSVVARLIVRIEADGDVNVTISILDRDRSVPNRQVGNLRKVGSIEDADIIQKLDKSIYDAIYSAMKTAAIKRQVAH